VIVVVREQRLCDARFGPRLQARGFLSVATIGIKKRLHYPTAKMRPIELRFLKLMSKAGINAMGVSMRDSEAKCQKSEDPRLTNQLPRRRTNEHRLCHLSDPDDYFGSM
jgi:hypothetical protein